MSIFMEYECSLDRDYDILMRRFEIATERAEAVYAYESCIADVDANKYITEANKSFIPEEEEKVREASTPKIEKMKRAFKNFISKIVKYMRDLIYDVTEMISNLFKKDDLDYKTYAQSETAKERFDFDCVDVELKVADEVRKGRKMIQAISKGTHIDDATVEHYVDKGANYIMNHKEVVIGVPVAIATIKLASKKTKAAADDIEAAGKDAENVTDPVKQAKIKRIFGAMQKKVKIGTDALHQYTSKITKGGKKAKKSEKPEKETKNDNE